MTSPSLNDKSPSPKQVWIETWGCQMNVRDSEEMLQALNEAQYSLCHSAEDADLVLLNTCHIREKAKHKVLSRLGELRLMKKLRPAMRIAVAGCVAQAEGERLMKEAPVIDILLGPGQSSELLRLLKDHEKTGLKQSARGFKTTDSQTGLKASQATASLRTQKEVSRFVNISQGCNNFCTFCVVPFTRGPEISKAPAEVIKEVSLLIEGGAREITLLGQNVNSYGLDLEADRKLGLDLTKPTPFVHLIEALLKLPGLERLRFTTSNPHDFPRPLAELYGRHPKLGRYLHLPVQSGNNEILARMKRKVTREEYLERVSWLREACPDLALSTDIIVGFPGETEEQFEDTLSLVREVGFHFIFAFKYSPRRGTAAQRFRDQISEELKSERLEKLNKLQAEISELKAKNSLGSRADVLILYQSQKEPGIYYGRNPHFQLVRIPSEKDICGQLIPVEIKAANKTALVGHQIHS